MFSLKFNTCTTLVQISQGAAKCVKFCSAQNHARHKTNKPHETPLGERTTSWKKARPCVDRMSQLARICRRGWNLDCYWDTWIKTSCFFSCETWIRVSWLWCLPTEVGVLRTPPLRTYILDFYTELVSTHLEISFKTTNSWFLEADVHRLGVRISSHFFFFLVDDEVETKLEMVRKVYGTGAGGRKNIVGSLKSSSVLRRWINAAAFDLFSLSIGVLILGGTLIA